MQHRTEIKLAGWLLEKTKAWGCKPEEGTLKVGGNVLEGWEMLSSGEDKIFWVAEPYRELAGAKYLYKKGNGVMPTLFVVSRGVIVDLNKQIPQEVLESIQTHGLVLAEGWKGCLALCAVGFNSCTTGGCNCGVATIKKLEGWGVPIERINYIFPDSDILSNPQVTNGYQGLIEYLNKKQINPKVLIPTPKPITAEGDIQMDKRSPDDWLTQSDTKEQVLNKTQKINIESINNYHKKIRKLYYQDTQINKRVMDHLTDKFIYLSDTKQYFLYNPAGYWETPSAYGIIDSIIQKSDGFIGSYRSLENTLKLVAPKFMQKPQETYKLFSKREYIGFTNGVYNLNSHQFGPHSPTCYLSGILPFEFNPTVAGENKNLSELCPKLCSWLIDRANYNEIYANILVAFLLLAVLDVRNPERFLFLSGYSSTGKSTYFKLLTSLLPENKSYTVTSETITTAFGLQDLTGIGKSLIIFQDLGGSVSAAFINLIRNLVSSGEAQNVSRKFETTAKVQFEGIIAAASNKNPFSGQQREGLADRRMIYVPFVNRVPQTQLQPFENIFPKQELQTFVAFAMKQDPTLILQFIRIINQDTFVLKELLDSYKENKCSLYLQNFIRDKIAYIPNKTVWSILGSPEDNESGSSLYSAYLLYTKEKGVTSPHILGFNNFRQEFLPLINSYYPSWDVNERRRKSDGTRKVGLENIRVVPNTATEYNESPVDLTAYRAAPFWLHLNKEDGYQEPKSEAADICQSEQITAETVETVETAASSDSSVTAESSTDRDQRTNRPSIDQISDGRPVVDQSTKFPMVDQSTTNRPNFRWSPDGRQISTKDFNKLKKNLKITLLSKTNNPY